MFLDVDQFPFLEPLRRAWADIRDECLALADDSFEPWVQRQGEPGSHPVAAVSVRSSGAAALPCNFV